MKKVENEKREIIVKEGNRTVINRADGIVKYTMTVNRKMYSGKSQVNKKAGDVFNEELGVRIARLRATLAMKRDQIQSNKNLKSHIISWTRDNKSTYLQRGYIEEINSRISRLEHTVVNIKKAIAAACEG